MNETPAPPPNPPRPAEPVRDAVVRYRWRTLGIAAAVGGAVIVCGSLLTAGLVRLGLTFAIPPMTWVLASAVACGAATAAWLLRRGVTRRAVAAALDEEAGLNDRLLTLAVLTDGAGADAGDARLARLRRDLGAPPRSRRGRLPLRVAGWTTAAAVAGGAAWLLVEPRESAAAAVGVFRGTGDGLSAVAPVLLDGDGRPLGPVREVAAGRTFRVRVRWSDGVEPSDPPPLFVRPAAGGRGRFELVAAENGFHPVRVDGDDLVLAAWTVPGGPTASAVLRPVPEPSLAGVELRVAPPAYLAAEPYPVPPGRVELVAGSRLTVRTDLRDVAGPPTLSGGVWEPDGGAGDAFSAAFPAPGRVGVIAEVRGRLPGSVARFPIATVVVREDAPPAVRLERATDTPTATPTARLPFTAVAEDDQGVAALVLEVADVADPTPAATRRIPLLPGGDGIPTDDAPTDAAAPRTVRRGGTLAVAGFDMREGDRLRLTAVAEDARGAAGAGRSSPVEVLVVSDERKREELARRAAALIPPLRAVADRLAAAAPQTPAARRDAASAGGEPSAGGGGRRRGPARRRGRLERRGRPGDRRDPGGRGRPAGFDHRPPALGVAGGGRAGGRADRRRGRTPRAGRPIGRRSGGGGPAAG